MFQFVAENEHPVAFVREKWGCQNVSSDLGWKMLAEWCQAGVISRNPMDRHRICLQETGNNKDMIKADPHPLWILNKPVNSELILLIMPYHVHQHLQRQTRFYPRILVPESGKTSLDSRDTMQVWMTSLAPNSWSSFTRRQEDGALSSISRWAPSVTFPVDLATCSIKNHFNQ